MRAAVLQVSVQLMVNSTFSFGEVANELCTKDSEIDAAASDMDRFVVHISDDPDSGEHVSPERGQYISTATVEEYLHNIFA